MKKKKDIPMSKKKMIEKGLLDPNYKYGENTAKKKYTKVGSPKPKWRGAPKSTYPPNEDSESDDDNEIGDNYEDVKAMFYSFCM